MKTNRLFRLFFLLCSSALFAGCIHEFPGDNPADPSLIDVSVTLTIRMEFRSDTIFQTYAGMLEGDYDIRYIVDIYNDDPDATTRAGDRIARIVKTESNLATKGSYTVTDTLQLLPKKYQIVAWIDFVDRGTTTDKYYNTDDLQHVSIVQQGGQYHGYNTTKDAFIAKSDMDLTPLRGQRYASYNLEMEATRPFAVYRIITIDMERYRTYHQSPAYASLRPYSTNVWYDLFFPMGFNAFLNVPLQFTAGVNYSYNIMEVVPEQEAEIASDYVFVGDDTFYLVDFEILTPDGERINTVHNLRINLKQNCITIIRDEFLTKDLNNGGIGIDDRFSDEIIIQI